MRVLVCLSACRIILIDFLQSAAAIYNWLLYNVLKDCNSPTYCCVWPVGVVASSTIYGQSSQAECSNRQVSAFLYLLEPCSTCTTRDYNKKPSCR